MKRSLSGVAALALLAGCATPPLGPNVYVQPGPNKDFAAFQQDQSLCTSYASQQVGGQSQQANNQAVGGAILGTVLGAGIGAAAGGGTGAAIGAASGAALGTGAGAGYSANAQYGIQRRYDIAYAQCMTAQGNKAPASQAAYTPAPGPYPAYGYPYPYYAGYGYYGPGWYGPPVAVGFGWGWGWRHHW
jgi:outer membrane lipoprotein SlyB